MNNTEKWDKPLASFRKLWELEAKKHVILQELGTSIAYHRALAQIGIEKRDIQHVIRGNQIAAIDNYKIKRQVQLCRQYGCSLHNRPQTNSQCICPECQSELAIEKRSFSASDLRTKFGAHMVGVVTQDGKRHWFQEPLDPQAWRESPIKYEVGA